MANSVIQPKIRPRIYGMASNTTETTHLGPEGAASADCKRTACCCCRRRLPRDEPRCCKESVILLSPGLINYPTYRSSKHLLPTREENASLKQDAGENNGGQTFPSTFTSLLVYLNATTAEISTVSCLCLSGSRKRTES
jgi:hypothetical protein